jgi:DNA-binding PucR family transcriptional regulator
VAPLPDQQIGIAHVPSERSRGQLLEILRRSSSARVGVSQQFDDLADTAAALRHARLALNGRGDTTEVMVFDDSVLAIAAVMAPETDIELAASVLGSLQDLPPEDKNVLFKTFRAWMNHRGSHAATAELFCHPGTVRYRLRRIEESTGRDLSAPRELAELCLAFEIDAKFS